MGTYSPYSKADDMNQELQELIDNTNTQQSFTNPNLSELAYVNTVVFLSRSMPENIILALLEQAKDDVVYVYKGWGKGPIDQIVNYTYDLYKKLPVDKQQNPPNIVVLPSAFAQYNIEYVPAILHKDTDNKWYLIQGAISIDGSIQQIKKRNFAILSQQFKVTEPDQAQVLHEIAKQHDWNNEINQATTAVTKQLQGSLNLPTATEDTHFKFKPYMIINHDVIDPKTSKVIYPNGTQVNILGLDPTGNRTILAIDGKDVRQVNLAHRLLNKHKDMLILYTNLGGISQAKLTAYPLDENTAKQLQIKVVPTFIQQKKMEFNAYTIKPK